MIKGQDKLTVNSAFPFYADIHPEHGRKWFKKHTGVDIICKEGAEFFMFTRGTVTGIKRWGKKGMSGANYIRFRPEGSEDEFVIKHFKPLKGIKKGDVIEPGLTVAICDNSGTSTGPHLHLECRKTIGKKKNAACEPVQEVEKYAGFNWRFLPGEWKRSLRSIYKKHHPEALKYFNK